MIPQAIVDDLIKIGETGIPEVPSSLGHPLGMSGARLLLTAMRELEARKGK